MTKKMLAAITAVLLTAAFAALPAVAQSSPLSGSEILLKSAEGNSLCVNPTEKQFKEDLGNSKEFEPLEEGNSRRYSGHPLTPFPDEGASCAERVEEGKQPAPTHPTADGNVEGKGGFSDYYGGKVVQVYGQGIPGGIWVAPFAERAEENHEAFYDPNPSKQNPWPAYYIYDTSFNLECVSEATKITGEFYADNAAGVFLNGEWIGKDHMQATPENYGYFFSHGINYPPTKFTANAGRFVSGKNVLQFIVLNNPGDWTALDFSAAVTAPACASPAHWYSDGKRIPAGTTEQTYSWGKLTFSTGVGAVATCKKSDAGNVWNPEAGTGLDDTVLFDLYECQGEKVEGEEVCPDAEVTASGLPWQSELEEVDGVIRDRTTGMTLTIDCEEEELGTFTGELAPKVINGSATKASFEEFEAASGELHEGGSGPREKERCKNKALQETGGAEPAYRDKTEECEEHEIDAAREPGCKKKAFAETGGAEPAYKDKTEECLERAAERAAARKEQCAEIVEAEAEEKGVTLTEAEDEEKVEECLGLKIGGDDNMAGFEEDDRVITAMSEPEFPGLGRCTKVTAKTGKYKKAGCETAEVEGGSYEWLPGPVKNKFTSSEGKSTFETVAKEKLVCASDTDSGEYRGESEDVESIVFSMCELVDYHGTTEKFPCTQVTPAVVLKSLYGFITPPKIVGVSLEPLSGNGPLFEFQCGGLRMVITGSVITPITPISKMTKTFIEKFKAVHGKQVPEKFTGAAPKDTLACTVYEGTSEAVLKPTEQCGLTSTDTIANEEELEIREAL